MASGFTTGSLISDELLIVGFNASLLISNCEPFVLNESRLHHQQQRQILLNYNRYLLLIGLEIGVPCVSFWYPKTTEYALVREFDLKMI
jgi:hypothetical protein